MKKKLIVLISCVELLSSVMYAQTLSVISEDSTQKTKIVFNAVNNKSADIYQIMGTSYATGMSSGVTVSSGGGYATSVGSSSMSGSNYRFICQTPNELEFDSGQLKLSVWDKPTYYGSSIFTISATGCTQYWDVKADSPGLYQGGIWVLSGGLAIGGGIIIGSVISSALALRVPGGLLAAGIVTSVVGLGAGIPMMVAGKSKVTLVRIDY